MSVLATDPRKLVAEFVGTFTLVFAGCGAVVANAHTGGAVTHVGIALTFGLAVCVMIYATGHLSGAHFNPAVSIGFASAGRFPWREVPAYIFAQCAAAIVAIALLKGVTGEAEQLGATVASIGVGPAIAFEAVLTFFLMFVISAVATDHRAEGTMAGVAIGGTVALCALFGGPFTGASMNPARTLGPALFTGELSSLWLYLAGPITGAVAASWTYRLIRCSDDDATEAVGCC